MAFSASDIGELRAAVPPEFQPPPGAAGSLSNHFSLSVDLHSKSTALQGSALGERDRHNMGAGFLGNLADGIEAAAPSFMLSGAQATARERLVELHRAEQRKDERFALEQMNAALDARLAELDTELAAIDKRIEEIRVRRIAIGESLEACDEIERLRRAGKKLDPKNPAHRQLMEAAGLSAEEANGDGYAAIIMQRRRDLATEDAALDTEWNAKMKRRGVVAQDRKQVAGARDEIENAHTPEARALAERRASTVLGAQQLGEAAYQTERKGAKRVAADAVVSNERDSAQPESQTLTRRAITGDEASIARSDVATFKLGG